MNKEKFIELLNNYGIDYYESDNIIQVLIDDINGISKDFDNKQNEIINILDTYPNLGEYTFYSENE